MHLAWRACLLYAILNSSSAIPTGRQIYLETVPASSLHPTPSQLSPSRQLRPFGSSFTVSARVIFLKNKSDHVTLPLTSSLTSLWPGGEVHAEFPVGLQPTSPGHPTASATRRSFHRYETGPLLKSLVGPLKPGTEASPAVALPELFHLMSCLVPTQHPVLLLTHFSSFQDEAHASPSARCSSLCLASS